MITSTSLCPTKNHCFFSKQSIPNKKRSISLSATLKTSPSAEVLSFWQWLKEEGIVSAKTPVRPAIVQEGLGLVAERDIARNDVILDVPRRLWINKDAAVASDIGDLCVRLKPWVCVALFLIREKLRESSSWQLYLDILPKQTDSTVFWSEKELKELQGTQLLSTTLEVKEDIKNEFLKVEKEIELSHKNLFPSITLDDFMWAFGVLRSRAFSCFGNQNFVMVPGADLINHSGIITTEDHALETSGPAGLFSWDLLISLRSPIDVKAGEQVYIQYGLKKSNADLALGYGFIELNSNRDAYTMTFKISKSDPFYKDKLKIAKSNGFGETACFDIFKNCAVPSTMLQYLRLVALGGADAFLLKHVFKKSIWGILALPVSHTNEELISRVVRNACTSALSGYHTTNKEDVALMERGKLDPRLGIAVRIRLAEKEILEQTDSIFREREMELNQLEYYQERELKELAQCNEQGKTSFKA